jgi:hypothetical protein
MLHEGEFINNFMGPCTTCKINKWKKSHDSFGGILLLVFNGTRFSKSMGPWHYGLQPILKPEACNNGVPTQRRHGALNPGELNC